MSSRFLLDTCALIFTLDPDDRFRRAERAIAEQPHARVLVSPFSAWELGMLASRGRIALGRDPAAWLGSFLQQGAELAPMTTEMLVKASFLPHSRLRDPADQIIAATARSLDATVVTRDAALLAYAEAGWIRALAC